MGLAQGGTLAGETAFKLYDTYGFPYDLTEDALRARGLQVDRAGFDAAMAEQKAKARAAWKGSGAKASEDIWFDLVEEHGATEFTGYSGDEGEGVVLAIVKDGAAGRARPRSAQTVEVLLNQTPFYGESGGQIGDTGKLTTLKGFVGEVEDTSKPLGKLHVLRTKVVAGELSVGETVHQTCRCASAATGSAPTTARRTCSTRRCAGIWARMSRRRAAWSRPTISGSTSRTPRR